MLGEGLLRKLDEALCAGVEEVRAGRVTSATVGVAFTVLVKDGEAVVSWTHAHKEIEKGSYLASLGPKLFG